MEKKKKKALRSHSSRAHRQDSQSGDKNRRPRIRSPRDRDRDPALSSSRDISRSSRHEKSPRGLARKKNGRTGKTSPHGKSRNPLGQRKSSSSAEVPPGSLKPPGLRSRGGRGPRRSGQGSSFNAKSLRAPHPPLLPLSKIKEANPVGKRGNILAQEVLQQANPETNLVSGSGRQAMSQDMSQERRRKPGEPVVEGTPKLDLDHGGTGPGVCVREGVHGALFYSTFAGARAAAQEIELACQGVDQLNVVIDQEGNMQDPELMGIHSKVRVYAGEAWSLIHRRRKKEGWYQLRGGGEVMENTASRQPSGPSHKTLAKQLANNS